MSKIYLEKVQKKFGNDTALDDLTLQINDKELIVFLGPSGCGKTTALNCIAGIEKPTSGRIYFNDKDVTDIPPHIRNVAMVFQSALLYPHLTARENIRLSLRFFSNLSKKEIETRVREVGALLGISSLLDKSPFQMSGGERQRVAIAKAIVRKPSVFLMDEPLSSLDAARREAIRYEIVVLQKKIANTMVFVTHDQVEAMTVGDRIAVMEAGKLQQVGTPDEIYNNPINTFVGGFVGSPPMNFFKGVVKRTQNAYVFQNSELHLEIPNELVRRIKNTLEEKAVNLGVRPQHISLSKTSKQGALVGKIYGVERLGKETVGIVQYEDDNKFKVIVDPSFKLSIGDVVYALPQSEQVYLFDFNTKINLLLK
jgi:ABC-type sugar transport system ATPase subunit